MNEDGGAILEKMEPLGPPAGGLGGVAKTVLKQTLLISEIILR